MQAAKRELASTPGVAHVGFNYVLEQFATVNDPLQQFQWGMQRIGALRAFDASTGANTRVAVIDGGLDFIHPEFSGAVLAQGEYFTATPGDGIAEDNNGHGTHVAGIAAANTNNGYGVFGASPQCRSAHRKGLRRAPGPVQPRRRRRGAASTSRTSGASTSPTCRSAAQQPPRDGAGGQLRDEPRRARRRRDGEHRRHRAAVPGLLRELARGHEHGHQRQRLDVLDHRPAGRHRRPGGTGGFPGNPEDILSTVPGFLGAFDYKNGTSMSSPHVAGTAALLAAQGMNAQQIRTQLENSSTDLGACGRDTFYGAGRLDASAAVGLTPDQANCVGPSPESDACKRARNRYAKAVAKLKHAIKQGNPRKILKAKKKKRKRKQDVIALCGSL